MERSPDPSSVTKQYTMTEASPATFHYTTRGVDLCKNYSKTANRTLTTFANEMSEILKESMEHMDCLNLMVRGVCNSNTNAENKPNSSLNMIDMKGDRGGYLKYKHILKGTVLEDNTTTKVGDARVYSAPLFNYRKFSEAPKFGPVQEQSQTAVRRIKEKEDLGDSGTKFEVLRKSSSVLMSEIIPRRKNTTTSLIIGYNQEKSVMDSIRRQHKKTTDKDPKLATKDDLNEKSTSENFENRLKVAGKKPSKRIKRMMKRKIRKPSEDRLGQPLIKRDVEESLDDMCGDSQTNFKKKGAKITRLSRKYANENFHGNMTKDRPIFEDDQYGGKKIKILSENKKDWVVLMHTQKPTIKHDSKPHQCRINNILETITLKDLEPLKAEYPRKDHILEPIVQVEDSLLYKLVNQNSKSLERLVDIDNIEARKFGRKHSIVKHIVPKENFERIQTVHKSCVQPQVSEVKLAKRKIRKRKVSKDKSSDKKENDRKYRTAISLKQYQMYKNISKNDAKTRLRKYMIDPEKSYKQEIIAMPVLVNYDQDMLPHISEVNSKETIVTEDILRPYIYSEVSGQLSRTPTAVMTVTVPNIGDMNKRLLEPNKPVVTRGTEPSVMVQRVVNCKQPGNLLTRSKMEGSQLISFISTEKQSVTDSNFYNPSKGSRRYSVTGKAPLKNARTKIQTKSTDLKAAIDGMERRLKEIIDQPNKKNAAIMYNMEKEMKSILSNMQIDMDSPDFSVASSSTHSSVYCYDKANLMRSKTNLDAKHKLTTGSTSSMIGKTSRPQSGQRVVDRSNITLSTNYATSKESNSKLLKSLDPKGRTRSTSKEIDKTKFSRTERKPVMERFRGKQLSSHSEPSKQLKPKAVQQELKAEDSIIELKKPPRSPRRTPELHVIMAPERDYNNVRKSKVEEQNSAIAAIKFVAPHPNISIPPKVVPSKTDHELTVIYSGNDKKKKEALKKAEVQASSQQKVATKILTKWQTLEHPSMDQMSPEHKVNKQGNNMEIKVLEVLKEDTQEKVEEEKEEVIKSMCEIKPLEAIEKKETMKKVSEIKTKEVVEKKEVMTSISEPNQFEKILTKETSMNTIEESKKSEPLVAAPPVIEKPIEKTASVHRAGSITVEPAVVNKLVNFAVDTSDLNNEQNIDDMKHQLSEESKSFCNEVNDVIYKIQEQNIANLDAHKSNDPQNLNIKMHKIRSEEFWTPFMHAVKTFRKEEHETENFYDFMKEKGHIRKESSERVRHKASINCMASEHYITKRTNRVTYQDWTDSDMNIPRDEDDTTDLDISVEQSSYPTYKKKCLKRMTYHERLSEIARRKFEMIKKEPVTKVLEETMLAATQTPTLNVKHITFNENTTLLNEVCTQISESRIQTLQMAVSDSDIFKYNKFLTYFYGLLFMTIFCGLNLKYSCT